MTCLPLCNTHLDYMANWTFLGWSPSKQRSLSFMRMIAPRFPNHSRPLKPCSHARPAKILTNIHSSWESVTVHRMELTKTCHGHISRQLKPLHCWTARTT